MHPGIWIPTQNGSWIDPNYNSILHAKLNIFASRLNTMQLLAHVARYPDPGAVATQMLSCKFWGVGQFSSILHPRILARLPASQSTVFLLFAPEETHPLYVARIYTTMIQRAMEIMVDLVFETARVSVFSPYKWHPGISDQTINNRHLAYTEKSSFRRHVFPIYPI